MEIQVLKAKEVEIPIPMQPPAERSKESLGQPDYVTKLRQRFLAGEELGPEDLRRIMVAAAEGGGGGGGNGNCNLC